MSKISSQSDTNKYLPVNYCVSPKSLEVKNILGNVIFLKLWIPFTAVNNSIQQQ